jgi:AhpD family alkylhydroperoxidase
MNTAAYPEKTAELAQKQRDLAPETFRAFRDFSSRVFSDGAVPRKVKELIAVAVAHATQCPYCIDGHARRAREHGASEEELMEAIWVAAEMRAGAAYAHSLIALRAVEASEPASPNIGLTELNGGRR